MENFKSSGENPNKISRGHRQYSTPLSIRIKQLDRNSLKRFQNQSTSSSNLDRFLLILSADISQRKNIEQPKTKPLSVLLERRGDLVLKNQNKQILNMALNKYTKITNQTSLQEKEETSNTPSFNGLSSDNNHSSTVPETESSRHSSKTPRKGRFRKVRCQTPFCIKLEHLDNVLFAQKYSEMTAVHANMESLNVSPNMNKSNLLESSTPQSQTNFSQELKKVLNDRNVLTSKTKKHVFDALDEIKTKGEEEIRRYKREKSVLEILETETKYVHQLETIIHFFLKPTQEKRLLKNDDFHTIFGNILPIYNINKELLDELEQFPSNVPKAFWRIAPFFKVYSVYACEFKNILKILQNARTLNPQFAKFVENQESRPEVQNKLSALLIAPIQRVPRYKLLLTQLHNLTKATDTDYDSLTDCLEKIEEAAEHINKIVDDHENMQRLLELQRILKSGEPTVVKPGRIVVKEGILVKMATKNFPSEKLYTVLMNDIILFGKMKKEELKVNSLKCVSIFPLGKCTVLEILDKGCMRIICQPEEFILYHEQLSETQNWIEKIRECIENHISDRKTLRKDSSSRRPVKRKDLHEYHEVGISPGRPLKKRRLEPDTVGKLPETKISGRRAITRTPRTFDTACTDITQCNPLTSRCWESVNEVNPEISKEVFIFGKPHPDDGFKIGKFLGGVGSSIKKMFGFRKT